MRFTRFILCALVLLIGTMAFAQTTATLVGTVTSDKHPLPGVTVTIASPQMQGTRTAVTGESGGYNFAALPPGSYKVTFELSGLATVTKSQTLRLDETSRVDADLKVSSVTEAITVTASTPSVLETPQVATNLSGKEVERLPIARGQQEATLLAPGVSGTIAGGSQNTPSAAQFMISGSPGYDNLVMVNGVVVSENIRSQIRPLYIEDAVQETTVMTGSISAEYGRFTGGVVNSITKSGGNEFSGSYRNNLSDAAWVAQTPALELRRKHVNEIHEGTLGGYVMKDRLWFFGAGRKAKTDTPNTLSSIPAGPGSSAGPATSYDRVTDAKRYEVKLTGQITPKHTIVGSYLKIQSTTLNDLFSASYDTASLTDRQDPESLESFHYNGILTANLLLEGQYSKRKQAFVNNGSKFTDIIKGTLLLDRNNGNIRFNSPTFCGVCDTETRNNNEYLAKINYFLNTKSLGTHNFVGGIDRFEEQRYANNFQSGSNFRIFVTRAQFANGTIYPVITPTTPAGANTFIRWTPIFTGANESNLRTDSAFVNDKWDFNNHWTFNVGFRFDKNNAVDGNGTVSSNDSKVTPRLGAYYDIKGDGRHRVSVSYGQYASHIIEAAASQNNSAGTPATIDFNYLGPSINTTTLDTPLPDAIAAVFNYFNTVQGGTANVAASNLRANGAVVVFPGFSAVFPNPLSSPTVDEWTVGYGAQLGTRGFAKVDLIHRDWHDFYAAQVNQGTPHITKETLPNGAVFNIPLDEVSIVNSDKIKRTYRGLQFQARYNPSRFQMGLNYTYSVLKGNAEVETANNGPGAVTDFGNYYAELLNYANFAPMGYLAGDERHRARAWVGMDVPVPHFIGALNVSVLQNYDSGLPYSAIGSVFTTGYTGAPAVPAYYNQPPATGTYYFSKRGEFRYPNIKSTNLALRWSHPIGRVELFAQGDVLNVLNKHDVISGKNTTVNTSASGTTARGATFNPFTGSPTECVPYQQQPNGNISPATGAQCAGNNWARGGSFGELTGNVYNGQPHGTSANYQTPRTVRGSFGVRF